MDEGWIKHFWGQSYHRSCALLHSQHAAQRRVHTAHSLHISLTHSFNTCTACPFCARFIPSARGNTVSKTGKIPVFQRRAKQQINKQVKYTAHQIVMNAMEKSQAERRDGICWRKNKALWPQNIRGVITPWFQFIFVGKMLNWEVGKQPQFQCFFTLLIWRVY